MQNELLIGVVGLWIICSVISYFNHKKIRPTELTKLLFSILALFTGINFVGVVLFNWPFIVGDENTGTLIAGGFSIVLALAEIGKELKLGKIIKNKN